MNSALEKISVKIKNLSVKNIIYIALAAISVILFSVLLAVALAGDKSSEIVIKDCSLNVAEGTRREYLSGETVTADGLSLTFGDTEITDCEIASDTSSAGIKRLAVTHQEDNVLYRAYFDITVFTIRHSALEGIKFYIDENGMLAYENDVVKLDLNASPTEFLVENADMPNVVTLDKSMYNINCERDKTDAYVYSVSISMEKNTLLSYTCVDLGTKVIQLDSSRRILKLDNVSSSSETLTLYVDTVENNGNDGENGATGTYVFVDAFGNKNYYSFKYFLNGYASNFVSASVNGGNLVDSYISAESETYKEGMQVVVGGVTFRANKIPWHIAVLDRND